MTSPLCWAAATSTVTSQEPVPAPSSKTKGSKVHRPRGKAMGRAQAWPAHHSKTAASFQLMKSSVQAQVLELQRKIQLLEGDRKAFYESSQWNMKKNQDTINHLQEETKSLHMQLKDLLQGDSKVVQAIIQEWRSEKPYLKNRTCEVSLATTIRSISHHPHTSVTSSTLDSSFPELPL